MSTNGGTTYGTTSVAPSDLTTKLEGGVITSVDVAPYYSNNILSIIIGVNDTASGTELYSNVLIFTSGGFSWDNVGTKNDVVVGVKFSPNHMNDAEIMSVYVAAADPDAGGPLTAGTILSSHIGTLAWGAAGYPDVNITAAASTKAIFALPTAYNYNSGTAFLVGLSGASAGLYSVTGRTGVAGTVSTTKAPVAATDIKSITLGGGTLANVFVGLANATTVYATTNITAVPASVTWTTAVEGPTGLAANGVTVFARGSSLYALTSGANGALSVSTDSGVNFNQISLIRIAVGAINDVITVDNNTMFIVVNGTDLFKTTDGAVTWQRIWTATSITSVSLSPSYATDQTMIFSDGTSVWKSTNGGQAFSQIGVPTTPTIVKAGTSGAIYAATNGSFVKVGRWSNATFYAADGTTVVAPGNITSIAINSAGSNIAIATDGVAGGVFVSANDGVSFKLVIDATSLATVAATKVTYAGSTLYAVIATNVYRFSGTNWVALNSAFTYSEVAVATDGTLYAIGGSAINNAVLRSLNPTAVDAAGADASEFGTLTNAGLAVLSTVSKLSVVNTATDNTVYYIGTASADTASFGYAFRVYGFKDTFAAPVVASTPAAGAVLTTEQTATISWTAFTGATSYEVIVDNDADFLTPILPSTTVTTTTRDLTGLSAGVTYYWKVRANATAAGTLLSKWSVARTFTTALTPPTGSVVSYPTLGANDVAIDTSFAWNGGGISTATYEIQIGTDSAFSTSSLVETATVNTNAYQLVSPLSYNTEYFWRVRTKTSTSTSAWTTAFFTTEKEPVVTTTTGPTTPVTTTVTVPGVTTTIAPVTTTFSFPVTTVTYTPADTGDTGIPTYLIWAVIAIGAVLVIAVIVLIVRTRRIS
jgi:hypothetical protein